MKNIFSILLLTAIIILLPVRPFAQVTIGTVDAPQDFSVLELISDTQGLRLPQMSTADRNTMRAGFGTRANNEALGLQIFNTDTRCVETWNGRIWISECLDYTTIPPDPVAHSRVTAFVNVLYCFQPQRFETWITTPATFTPVLIQWQVSTDNNSWTNIAGANTAVWTLPANYIHNAPAPFNTQDELFFRALKVDASGTVITQQAQHTLQILFIRTTYRGLANAPGHSDFREGFGMDNNGVRFAYLSRAPQTAAGLTPTPDYIRVALLNVGATDNDGVGLGDFYQWGRTSDGHQHIVWGRATAAPANAAQILEGVNNFIAGTSPNIARLDNMAAHINTYGQATGQFASSFITSTGGDWGQGAPDRNDLWGVAANTRAASPVRLGEWTDRAIENNPCARLGEGWRVPSQFEWSDMHNASGSGALVVSSLANSWGTQPHNDNDWGAFRPRRAGAVGGAVIRNTDTDAAIFLPAAGIRSPVTGGFAINNAGTHGRFWSSTRATSANNALHLSIMDYGVSTGTHESARHNGFSVRCVWSPLAH